MGERAALPGLASGSVGDRMIAAMRLILAASALLVVAVDPPASVRYPGATYAALVAYAAYSTIVLLLVSRRAAGDAGLRGWDDWVDLLWYTPLAALSGGPNSVLFFFYFFSILAASFRRGFAHGLRITTAAVVLFTLAGLAMSGDELPANRLVLRIVCLVVLGYMTARWGEYEVALKRRLALLGEVTSVACLRSGVDEAAGSVLEQLRAFYAAEQCVQILEEGETGAFRIQRVAGRGQGTVVCAEPVPEDLADALLVLRPGSAVAFWSRNPRWWRTGPLCADYDAARGEFRTGDAAECEAIAARLDAECFLSVPVRDRGRAVGRIFLTAREPIFAESDIPFLLQVVEHAAPVVENVRLADHCAAEAAERERVRIARDLHDSVVQSYIGLELGLEALHRRLARGDLHVVDDVERLAHLARGSVVDLRRYMRELRYPFELEDGLVPAVRRFVVAYARETGIAVDVEAEPDVRIGDELATEAFHIVAEGLSNVRRHTTARFATVRIGCAAGHLRLSVENEAPLGQSVAFTPRSILERAGALGGDAAVEAGARGQTVVRVTVPLRPA